MPYTLEIREVWVITPTIKKSWHKSLELMGASGLSGEQIDSLFAVNTEFYQDGETLVIVGSYGYFDFASKVSTNPT